MSHYLKQFSVLAFIATVILIQIMPWYIGLILASLFLTLKLNKTLTTKDIYFTSLLYIIGYCFSDFLQTIVYRWSLPDEWGVILSRLSLFGFILPFFILNYIKKPEISFLSIGSFRNTIYFPFIWRGVFKDPIWRFLIIFSSMIVVSFGFIIDFKQQDIVLLLVYALVFSIVNSILEEILWRGYILSRIVSDLGEKFGLVVTSIGFGFYHYSLGIPWILCVAFSIFGMIMGGVAIRSRGLLPVIIMHFLMNIMFVFIGMIF
ncbi:type II CAAX endopeptidase family protein [Paenibacillus sp. LHD-117]|uniref:CPBP family intramembrane glutamic endopeptidase n=1 Tax=Paenibacillus sp. LHD-117 TaxID=3071412 RepID=UPI0027DFA139|nr:type II CAAX endopeptidase family protein [Paenibacillus sp. LHD-117]MDQ6423650.1 type II CAAX endopeptidase family protein [Paenibacillus sp. LHD-117]